MNMKHFIKLIFPFFLLFCSLVCGCTIYGHPQHPTGTSPVLPDNASSKIPIFRSTKSSTSPGEVKVVPTDQLQSRENQPLTEDQASNLTLIEQIGLGTAEKLAWTPDGSTIVVGGYLGVHLYDSRTWTYAGLLESDFPVSDFSISGDAELLAVGSPDGQIQFWEFPSGNLQTSIKPFSSEIIALGFSSQSRMLVCADEEEGSIQVWDVQRDREVYTNAERLGYGSPLFVNHAGTMYAFADNDNTIYLAEFSTGNTVKKIQGHDARVIAIAFSLDDKQLATASEDGVIILWSISPPESAKHIKTIGVVPEQRWYPTQRTWDPGMYRYTDWAPGLVFSSDGELIFAGALDNIVRYWGIDFSFNYSTYGGDRSIAFNPSGSLLASIGSDSILYVWEYDFMATTQNMVRSATDFFGHTGPVVSLTIDPKTLDLVSSDPRGFHRWSHKGNFPNNDFYKIDEVRAYSESARFMTIFPASGAHPDLSVVAAGGLWGTIVLYNGETGQYIDSFSAHPDPVGLHGSPNIEEIVFSPRGDLMASIGVNGDVTTWSTNDWETQNRYFLQWSHSLTFDPSGHLLAFVGMDYESGESYSVVQIQLADTGDILAKIRSNGSTIALSPALDLIAIGNNEGGVDLYSLPGGELKTSLQSTNFKPTASIFSDDGRVLFVGMEDGSVQVWAVETQVLLSSMNSHKGPVSVLVYQPKLQWLFSGSHDGTIIRWGFPPSNGN